MYFHAKVHVPEKFHQRIKNAMTKNRPLSVRIGVTKDGEDVMLLTQGQMNQISKAIKENKKLVTLRLSQKQVQANVKTEGGFLSTLMQLATKALPIILSGLATGVISSGVEKAIGGNGLFLGRRGAGTAKVEFNGNGIVLTPVQDEKLNGLYLRHEGQVFQGKGLLLGANSPFKNIPILGLLL